MKGKRMTMPIAGGLMHTLIINTCLSSRSNSWPISYPKSSRDATAPKPTRGRGVARGGSRGDGRSRAKQAASKPKPAAKKRPIKIISDEEEEASGMGGDSDDSADDIFKPGRKTLQEPRKASADL